MMVAVVPVFNPEPGLVPLCEDLCRAFDRVVVVDDGSVENREAFARLPAGVTRLTHPRNRGKGAALKTAFRHLAQMPDLEAVVCADGDGQHRVEDVCRVAARCRETARVTFGVRNFLGAGVPFRSRWGNLWTTLEVRLLFGFWLGDTQTGLRALPARLLPHFIDLPGERFEYEAAYFRLLQRLREPLEQIPIATRYGAGNRSSHFRPVRDTLLTQRALFG